jgi:hypothetical protein
MTRRKTSPQNAFRATRSRSDSRILVELAIVRPAPSEAILDEDQQRLPNTPPLRAANTSTEKSKKESMLVGYRPVPLVRVPRASMIVELSRRPRHRADRAPQPSRHPVDRAPWSQHAHVGGRAGGLAICQATPRRLTHEPTA